MSDDQAKAGARAEELLHLLQRLADEMHAHTQATKACTAMILGLRNDLRALASKANVAGWAAGILRKVLARE